MVSIILFVARVVVAPGLANVALKPGPGVPPVQLAAADQFSTSPAPPDQTALPRMPPLPAVTNVQLLVVEFVPVLSLKMTVTVLVAFAGKLLARL